MAGHLEIHNLKSYKIPTFYGTHSINQHVFFLDFLFPHLFFHSFPFKNILYSFSHPHPDSQSTILMQHTNLPYIMILEISISSN